LRGPAAVADALGVAQVRRWLMRLIDLGESYGLVIDQISLPVIEVTPGTWCDRLSWSVTLRTTPL
jgi:hypothetical protein